MAEWILNNWEFVAFLITAVITGVVWLVRLEGKVKHSEAVYRLTNKRVDELEIELHTIRDKQMQIDSELAHELKGIQIELAQIKGYLMQGKKYEKRV
jgi:hypothetical protein